MEDEMHIEIERVELAIRLRYLRDECHPGWMIMRSREARELQNALIMQACDALASAPIITVAHFEMFLTA